MPQSLSLVILAAGLGSRFGGLKQLEQVGPGGAAILDYTVFDAIRAGVTRVVVVVRPETEADFRQRAAETFGRRVEVRFAVQRLEDVPAGFAVPAGRRRPWGTGQALLAAASEAAGPCVVANADDFYGAGAISLAAGFLRQGGGSADEHALVGFRLRETLSESGPVNRACCRVSAGGWLERLVEVRGIVADGRGARLASTGGGGEELAGIVDAEGRLAGEQIVSMNLWALRAGIFEKLQRGFDAFLEQLGVAAATRAGVDAEEEFYLPAAVEAGLRAGQLRVRVLPTTGRWCGVTYAADLPLVRAELARRVAAGEYPERLWE